MGKLDGKIALISGGSSGIGLATAKRFVAEGAYIFITGRSRSSSFETSPCKALIFLLMSFAAAASSASRRLYDFHFNINVKGMLFTVQKALPLIPNGGAILLASSIVGSKGLGTNSVYAATKAVARSFARTWTTDLKQRRIRVNAISPGSIDTPGLDGLLASAPAGEERRKMIHVLTPLGRLGTADEIARAAVFLASDDASYITGIELFVDGGFAQV